METKNDNNDEKSLHVAAIPEEEPLGSLTITDLPELKGQQLRSSARVFKKMKLDATPLTVPEKNEKKEEIKQDKKRCCKPLWTSDDKTLFFEALNEYGKDFESIQLYLSNKFRKKGVPDQFIKTKDQIRHLYYRTWVKISKHLKFADVIKKPTQELYGLINYGELRKKVGSVNEKYLLQLNKLVYKGSIMLSIKGKKIRVKTPFCRALRKLNQLDDKYEEIKLPNRLTVELRPKDMTSFLRVQSTAQNPRIKTYNMGLQKRLSSIIECLSKKWQSVEAGMYDKALISSSPVTSSCVPNEKEITTVKSQLNPLLRLTPPKDSKIEIPSISMSEYFTPQGICFTSHESRLGLSNYNSYCHFTYKLLNKGSKRGSRPRADSVSDKSEKSPHKNVSHNEDDNLCDTITAEPGNETNKDKSNLGKQNTVNGGGIIKEECNNIKESTSDSKENESGKCIGNVKQEVEEMCVEEVKPKEENKVQHTVNTAELEKQERIKTIRKGWTKKESESITLGELYLMFGKNSKIILEYSWDPLNLIPPKIEIDDKVKTEIDTDITKSNCSTNSLSNLDLDESLLKLLSVAKLHYRKNIVKCPCGHVCGTKNNAQLKKVVESKIRNILTDIDKCTEQENEEKTTNVGQSFQNRNGGSFVPPRVYLPPKLPISPYYQPNAMHVAAQIASIKGLPRYNNRKGRRPRAKQVVVERQLPLLPNNLESGHQIVRMSIISKEDSTIISPPPTEILTEPKPVTTTSNVYILQPQQVDTASNIITPEEVLDETLKSCIIDTEPSSPSRILKEGEHWINSEVGDYSLSSLLGHLESPMKSETNLLNDDSRMSQDVDAQLRSMMTQNSIDFSASFADLAAEVTRDIKSELG